jgi:DNA-binding IclR family transcriptional regulator
LSAIELGVFTALAEAPVAVEMLKNRIGIDKRGARDFFDALVALGLLDRDDSGRCILLTRAPKSGKMHQLGKSIHAYIPIPRGRRASGGPAF